MGGVSVERQLHRLLSEGGRSIHGLRTVGRALGLNDDDLDGALAEIGAFKVRSRTGHKRYALPDSEKVDPRPPPTPIGCGHENMWRSARGPWRCTLRHPPAHANLVHETAPAPTVSKGRRIPVHGTVSSRLRFSTTELEEVR